MHALLRREKTVGVVAFDREGDALDARLVTLLRVVDLDLEAAVLEPAEVHAQQHLGPVLRFGTAGAGVDGDDRTALVVAATEEALLLAALERALELRYAVHELLQELVVDGVLGQLLTDQLLGRLQIAEALFERRELG